MDTLLKSSFPIFSANLTFLTGKPAKSLQGPHQTATTRLRHQGRCFNRINCQNRTQLLDLAENGTLVLVEKRQFGHVPDWRTEFLEPEAIWLVGTAHILPESAAEVERVVRAVRPDNLVVELYRSRNLMMDFRNGSATA